MKIECLSQLNNIATKNWFLGIAVVYGLLMVIVTPPFQVPDEYAHFYRSFHLSEGKIKAKKVRLNDREDVGEFLPQSLKMTVDSVSQDLPFHSKNKQKIEDLISVFHIPLNAKDKTFLDFPNTAMYPPFPYIPQALGVFCGRLLNCPPIVLMYLGRISNLALWILIVYAAIKITPVFKWVFFLLALAPMSIFLAASLSADAFTNSIALLFIAIVLNEAFAKTSKITISDISALFLAAILVALSKLAYLPITLLVFLIPADRFSSTTGKILWSLSVFGVSAVVSAGWTLYIGDIYIPLADSAPSSQLDFIFTHPLKFIYILAYSIIRQHKFTVIYFLGDSLGWLDTSLPKKLIHPYFVILVIVALMDRQKDVWISLKAKLFTSIIFMANVCLIFTLLYLSWTAPMREQVQGMQARYFIPTAPLLYLLLYKRGDTLDSRKFIFSIPLCSIFTLTVTCMIILKRYY